MPTYQTSDKCYMGGSLREVGSTFTLPEPVKPLPKYLKKVKLTKEQQAQEIATAEAEAKAADDAAHEIELVTEKAPDFLGAEKELSPQQKAANTRKKNAEAKLEAQKQADVESTDDAEPSVAGQSDSGDLEVL